MQLSIERGYELFDLLKYGARYRHIYSCEISQSRKVRVRQQCWGEWTSKYDGGDVSDPIISAYLKL